MPEGVPYLRREVYKLRKRVQDLESNQGTLSALLAVTISQGVISVDVDITEFRTHNYSNRNAVQIRADDAGEPGWFVRQLGAGGDNGRDSINDLVGTNFKRIRAT